MRVIRSVMPELQENIALGDHTAQYREIVWRRFQRDQSPLHRPLL